MPNTATSVLDGPDLTMVAYVATQGAFMDNGYAPVRIRPYNGVRKSLLFAHFARYAQAFDQSTQLTTSGSDNQ